MTSLRLFETDRAATVEHATSHLFETRPRSERYRARGWPYATSVVLHSLVMISMVVLGHYLASAPRSTPSHHDLRIAHTFVFTGFSVGRNNRPRVVHKTQHSDAIPVAIAGDVAPAPLPPARGNSRTPDTSAIIDEKPPQPAFDPPIPAGEARLTGRRGDPTEAGLGSAATPNVRGLPTGEVKSGGLGDGNVHDAGTGPPAFTVRPGIEDGGGGDGAMAPRIQEPLPIPDYPAAARTRRLQGIVVLEVMLDSLGKAHVRGVLSDPLGFGIEEAAMSAAQKLRFTPARQGGRFVDAIVQVRVTFTLTGSATAVTEGGA
jgi:TonB family protein